MDQVATGHAVRRHGIARAVTRLYTLTAYCTDRRNGDTPGPSHDLVARIPRRLYDTVPSAS